MGDMAEFAENQALRQLDILGAWRSATGQQIFCCPAMAITWDCFIFPMNDEWDWTTQERVTSVGILVGDDDQLAITFCPFCGRRLVKE